MYSAKAALIPGVACSKGTFVITSSRAARMIWISSGPSAVMPQMKSETTSSSASRMTASARPCACRKRSDLKWRLTENFGAAPIGGASWSAPIRPALLKFRDDQGDEIDFTAPYATATIRRTHPLAVDEFIFLRAVTAVTPKITLPAPSTMHFLRFSDFADRAAYGDIERFFADLVGVFRQEIAELAAAGCRYLQIDEIACDWPSISPVKVSLILISINAGLTVWS
jgi:hypothetical protein